MAFIILDSPPVHLSRNTYLTNGLRLFRVEGTIDDPWLNGGALLEDCRTLKSDFYAADELVAMNLELVMRPEGG